MLPKHRHSSLVVLFTMGAAPQSMDPKTAQVCNNMTPVTPRRFHHLVGSSGAKSGQTAAKPADASHKPHCSRSSVVCTVHANGGRKHRGTHTNRRRDLKHCKHHKRATRQTKADAAGPSCHTWEHKIFHNQHTVLAAKLLPQQHLIGMPRS